MSIESLRKLRIVLCSTSHPGNIGATARAMLTMNVVELALVNPERFPHAQARAQASGAMEVLDGAKVFSRLEDAVADCAWVVGTSARPRHLGDEPMTPWGFAERALPLLSEGPVALVFGAERMGLTVNVVQRWRSSMNIAACPSSWA